MYFHSIQLKKISKFAPILFVCFTTKAEIITLISGQFWLSFIYKKTTKTIVIIKKIFNFHSEINIFRKIVIKYCRIFVSVFIEFIKVFKIGFEPFFCFPLTASDDQPAALTRHQVGFAFVFTRFFHRKQREEFLRKQKLLKIFSENSLKIYRIENDYCWRANSVRKIRGS